MIAQQRCGLISEKAIFTRVLQLVKGAQARQEAATARSRKAHRKRELDKSSQNNGDGSEWDFAPVTYPHIILDGVVDISTNAKIIVDEIESLVRPKHDE